MAGVALARRWYVRRRLGQGIDRDITATMTGRAVSDCDRPGCSGMAHDRRAEGSVVVMAGRTLSGGRNMGRGLAQCGRTMTGGTPANRSGVVSKGRACPGRRRPVAGVALRRSGDVGSRLDLGIDAQIRAAVASRTATGRQRTCRTSVVHRGGSKSRIIIMANIACNRCRQMRGSLAAGVGAIVAGGATPGDNSAMGVGCRQPSSGAMTNVTGLCTGRNVGSGLGLGIDRNITTAVTGRSCTGAGCHPGVRHRRRCEGNVVFVTGITLVTGWYVRTGLANTIDVVVTG